MEDGFELSEVSNTPVMLQVRIRCCHVHGHFIAKDNKRPPMTVADALDAPRRETGRIVRRLSFLHEKEKVQKRWPAAVDFIAEQGQEFFGRIMARSASSCRRHVQSVIRALQRLGLAELW